jgi:hypothetical protein
MEISLGNDWYLGKDQHNWILMRAIPVEKGKNAGSVRMATIGYYPNVQLACKAVIEKSVGDEGIKTMQEIKQFIEVSTRSICDAIEKSKGKLVV